MKTKLFFALALIFGQFLAPSAQPTLAAAPEKHPYIEVVITQNRIWLIPDETPVADLPVTVLNAAGETVVHKVFSTKTPEWSLDVTDLPTGKYKILIGTNQTEYLEKKGKKWVL